VISTVCRADVRFRRRGWSNYELAQLHRVIAKLCGVGFAFETDSGVTDEGDPWLVFCEADSGEIFTHFARIGGEYVVCAPCLDQMLTGTTLRQLADHFIDRCLCRHAASERTEGLLPTDHFVARENIMYFCSRLKSVLHPKVRSHVQRLLIEEEDKLGADLEFLAEVEQTIISFDALIETQKSLVAMLEQNGCEAGRERTILNGLHDTRFLCQTYHRKIVHVASGKTVL